MSKFNDLNSKIFVALGVIVFLVILLSSSSVQMEIFAAVSERKALFDCTYDNDKNKEICCDSSNNTLKCMECNVDLQTEQKYNCKEIPPKSNDAQPADSSKGASKLGQTDSKFFGIGIGIIRDGINPEVYN